MSFQGLISGAECAAPFNPLSQVLKHTEGDRSVQQDRVGGPSSSRLQHLPGTSKPQANEQDLAHAQQFFSGGPPPAQMQQHPSFASNHHLHASELNRLNSNGAPGIQAPRTPGEAWTMEQPQHQQQQGGGSAWASEFTPQQHIESPQIAAGHAQQSQHPSYMPSYNHSMPYSYSPYQSMPSYQQQMPTYNLDTKGKGKASEADFEAAFAKISAAMNDADQTSSARIVEIKDDEVDELEAKLKETTLGEKDPLEALLDNVPNGGDTLEDMASWESQFNEMMAAHRQEMGPDSDLNYTEQMQAAWERGASEDPLGENAVKFDKDGVPIMGAYEFAQNNPFMDPSTSTRSPLADAKLLLEQNGSLTEAALLLEAAIQKGELGEGGYEAWILLGETRNMDEREEAGMKALIEGVRLAEEAGASGEGMLSLAISFTNESYDRGSYSTLLRWLQTRFPTHPIPPSTIEAVRSHSTWETHERLTEVFIDLARRQHAEGVLDPDVQIGLGVLFYTNQAYDRAKDCFEAALTVRPNDFLLWNRYGSCLSNGAKPEEALHAYREALALRPTYTRAVYNVGVACLNIGAHKEAAEHFLSALSLQEGNGGDNKSVQSDGLWFILRRALLLMDRTDLAGMAKLESRPDLEVFRKEGFEF